tara:strand:- start:1820 stop:2407 length:588 start_codon:yes stop_codon:yes gene_type:complete
MKRLFDICLSLIGIIILFPLLVFVGLLVLIFMGWPVFFLQQRLGHMEKKFYIIKFRTMKKEDDKNNESDISRLTKFGSLLRSSSLDELPELFNVLKGDMSLVGPRPLLDEYLKLYTDTQRKRHNVLPGITGWAQINGRNDITWEKKFDLDLWYVENKSFYLDIKILIMTLFHIFKRKDISQKGHVTSNKFKGTKS